MSINMNEDLNTMTFSQLREINISHYFLDIQYNGKTLTDCEQRAEVPAPGRPT